MKEKIIFSGNCAWCMEALFLRTRGVTDVQSGFYSLEDYKELAFSTKDKLEAVQLTYDSLIISFDDLLSVYFLAHNPTANSWNPDDSFYPLCRPAVFYFTEEQKNTLIEKMNTVQAKYETPLFTKVEPFKPDNFVLVEEKYQRYFEKNPTDGYCTSIVKPKIERMKNEFKSLFVNLNNL